MMRDLGAFFGINFVLTPVRVQFSQIRSLLYLRIFGVVSESHILRVDQYASSFLNGRHVFVEILFLLRLDITQGLLQLQYYRESIFPLDENFVPKLLHLFQNFDYFWDDLLRNYLDLV